MRVPAIKSLYAVIDLLGDAGLRLACERDRRKGEERSLKTVSPRGTPPAAQWTAVPPTRAPRRLPLRFDHQSWTPTRACRTLLWAASRCFPFNRHDAADSRETDATLRRCYTKPGSINFRPPR